MSEKSRFDIDNKTASLFQRFTLAKAWVASQDVKKTGYSDFTKANFYELSDFIQPILDSQVKFELFSNVEFDYEKSIAYLHVYDALDMEVKPITYSFRFVEFSLSKGNPLQSEGAIQTYCRRYLYLCAWEITESDFGEMDPDAKIDKKKAELAEAKKAEEERQARIMQNLIELKEILPKVNITEIKVVEKYNSEYKKDFKNIEELPEVAVAGYLGMFQKRLEKQQKEQK